MTRRRRAARALLIVALALTAATLAPSPRLHDLRRAHADEDDPASAEDWPLDAPLTRERAAALAEALGAADAEARRRALGEVVALARAEHFLVDDLLAIAVGSPDADLWRPALRALAGPERTRPISPEATIAAAPFVSHDEVEVRVLAARVLRRGAPSLLREIFDEELGAATEVTLAEQLARALSDPDARIRVAVAEAIGESPYIPASLAEPLADAAFDPIAAVRRPAVRGLAKLARAPLDDLAEVLREDDDLSVRIEAAAAIGDVFARMQEEGEGEEAWSFGDDPSSQEAPRSSDARPDASVPLPLPLPLALPLPPALAALREALLDRAPGLAEAGADALRRAGSYATRALPEPDQWRLDDRTWMRAVLTFVGTTGERCPPHAIAAVERAFLSAPHAETRFECALTLESLGVRGIEAFARILVGSSADLPTRTIALESLARCLARSEPPPAPGADPSAPDAYAALVHALAADKLPASAPLASASILASALARQDLAAIAEPAMRRVLSEHADAAVRLVALRALAEALSQNPARPDLTEAVAGALDDPDADLRAEACEALSAVAATPALRAAALTLLGDPEASVRLAACQLAGACGPFAGSHEIAALASACADTDPLVRAAALTAAVATVRSPGLGSYLVEAALDDPDPHVRESANDLVGEVAPTPGLAIRLAHVATTTMALADVVADGETSPLANLGQVASAAVPTLVPALARAALAPGLGGLAPELDPSRSSHAWAIADALRGTGDPIAGEAVRAFALGQLVDDRAWLAGTVGQCDEEGAAHVERVGVTALRVLAALAPAAASDEAIAAASRSRWAREFDEVRLPSIRAAIARARRLEVALPSPTVARLAVATGAPAIAQADASLPPAPYDEEAAVRALQSALQRANHAADAAEATLRKLLDDVSEAPVSVSDVWLPLQVVVHARAAASVPLLRELLEGPRFARAGSLELLDRLLEVPHALAPALLEPLAPRTAGGEDEETESTERLIMCTLRLDRVPPEVAPILAAVATCNESPWVRARALAALARIGTPEVADEIGRAAEIASSNANPVTSNSAPTSAESQHAMAALLRIAGGRGSISDLELTRQHLEDSNLFAWCARRLFDEDPAALARVLASTQPDEGIEALAVALASLGEAALPHLCELLGHPDVEVRRAVTRAIETIVDHHAPRLGRHTSLAEVVAGGESLSLDCTDWTVPRAHEIDGYEAVLDALLAAAARETDLVTIGLQLEALGCFGTAAHPAAADALRARALTTDPWSLWRPAFLLSLAKAYEDATMKAFFAPWHPGVELSGSTSLLMARGGDVGAAIFANEAGRRAPQSRLELFRTLPAKDVSRQVERLLAHHAEVEDAGSGVRWSALQALSGAGGAARALELAGSAALAVGPLGQAALADRAALVVALAEHAPGTFAAAFPALLDGPDAIAVAALEAAAALGVEACIELLDDEVVRLRSLSRVLAVIGAASSFLPDERVIERLAALVRAGELREIRTAAAERLGERGGAAGLMALLGLYQTADAPATAKAAAAGLSVAPADPLDDALRAQLARTLAGILARPNADLGAPERATAALLRLSDEAVIAWPLWATALIDYDPNQVRPYNRAWAAGALARVRPTLQGAARDEVGAALVRYRFALTADDRDLAERLDAAVEHLGR